MIEDYNADIAECDFRRVKDYNFDFAKPEKEEVNITNNVEKLKELYSENEDEYVKTVVIWNKIYKKELFDELNILLEHGLMMNMLHIN